MRATTARYGIVVSFLLCASAHADDPVAPWFADQLVEVPQLTPARVTQGSLPPWLQGSLVRVGPGQFSTSGRNLTHLFDGLAYLHRWSVADGQVSFQSQYLRSGSFRMSREQDKFCKTHTIGRVEPPFGLFERSCEMDNTNVNVWRLAGDDVILVLTDGTVMNVVDAATLDTVGAMNFTDSLKAAVTSSAHPHEHPVTGDMVDFAVQINLLGPHTMSLFRMGRDKTRLPIGVAQLDKVPYIHSFALTQRYAAIAVFPVHLDLGAFLAGSAMVDAFRWTGATDNTTLLVFALDGNATAPPVATFTLPPFYSFHHVNAYEQPADAADAAGSTLVLDMAAYPDFSVLLDPHGFGNLEVLRNASQRAGIRQLPVLRRVTADLASGRWAWQDLPCADAQGVTHAFEFPTVSPVVAARKHCFVYGVAYGAGPDRAWTNTSLVKVDVCDQAPTRLWNSEGLLPSEPVFVPRPGGAAEDDGVLLTQVYDTRAGTSALVAVDAQSMQTVALARGPVRVPYDFHGAFFGVGSAPLV